LRCLYAQTIVARPAYAFVEEPDARIRGDRAASRVAILAGVIFIIAGLVKFVFHHWELNAFRSFGLPWPSALEIFAGVLETLGGILLVLRRFVAPVAVLLAVTMIVAIVSSGIGHGDVIPSLTLAPALLMMMLYLLVRGVRGQRRLSR
jgi:putative oxidoreductase